jgi:hypothetical protein
VRALPGKPFLVEYTDGKGQPQVDLVFWFGGKHAFLFPKDMAAHLRKSMQVAHDRVIDAILVSEGIEVAEDKGLMQGLSLPPEDVGADGRTGMQNAADPNDVPAPSGVNVMPTPVAAEEVSS